MHAVYLVKDDNHKNSLHENSLRQYKITKKILLLFFCYSYEYKPVLYGGGNRKITLFKFHRIWTI